MKIVVAIYMMIMGNLALALKLENVFYASSTYVTNIECNHIIRQRVIPVSRVTFNSIDYIRCFQARTGHSG